MASFGLFGSSAPQIRRLQPTATNFAPTIEDLRAQQAAQLQAASTDMAAPGPSRGIKFGAFGQGPANPAPAPAQPAPRGVTPAYLPAPAAGPAQSKDDGGVLRNLGYRPDETGQNVGEWLFSDRADVQKAKSEQAGKIAAQRAFEAQQAQVQALRQSGMPEAQIIAFLNNPEKWSENYSTNIAAANVGGGDSRIVNGEFMTAPKFGVDGGRGYTQTAEGTEWGNQRGKSYEEITNEGKLAEDVRNNNLTNSRGWATIGIERDKAAKAGLPDFGDENSFRNQYLGQAKPYQDVKAAAGRVKTLSADMNPAEQMALVFSTMKMLDPGSTVREGEYATAQNTTGIAGQAWNYYNKMQNGEFLNPTQIKEFRDMIGGLEREAEKSYVQTLDQYRSMAPRYRMDPSIIQDFRGPGAGPTPREQAAAASREVAARAGHAGGVMGGQGQFDPAAFANLRPSNDVSDLLDKYR